VDGLWVSGDFFPVLGVSAIRGRLFTARDDRRGIGPEGVVISYGFWQQEFGGAEDVVGEPLTLNDKVFTIIGVTPPDFFGLEIGRNFAVAIPVSARGIWEPKSLDERHVWWLTVMGRLKPGWDLKRAARYFDTISPGLFEATAPSGYSQSSVEKYLRFRLTALPAGKGVSRLRTDYEASLWLLLGITGLVLLIACTNLANLILARASAREREAAIRLAIGASRARLLRQSLCESLLLASAGALLGAILAGVLSQTLIWFLSTKGNSLTVAIKTDWKLFAFTGVVAILTCVVFGLAPAWRTSIVEPLAVLKGGGRGLTGGHERFLIQRALVVSQIAISLVLLTGTFLLVGSFWNLARVDPGFRKVGLIFAGVDFSRLNLPLDRVDSAKKELLERIRSIPNVQSAANTTHKPLTGSSWTMGVTFNGEEDRKGSSKVAWVSPDYFRTMEIPFRSGRDINDRDRADSPKVALVNQAFVQRFCGSTDPIGHHLRTAQEPSYPQADYEIIGVVGDTKYSDLRQEIWPIVYAPATQYPITNTWMQLAIRSSTDANALLPVLQRRIEEFNPQMGFYLSVLETEVRDGMARERLMAWLSGFFGALAMLLVTIGLYGVISYMTVRRRNELGIRVALGAQRYNVLGLILVQGMSLALIGIIIGTMGALAVTKSLRSLLFLVRPNEPWVFAGTSLLVLTVALLACWLPARRAASISPMEALRYE
jgi:predicted permease